MSNPDEARKSEEKNNPTAKIIDQVKKSGEFDKFRRQLVEGINSSVSSPLILSLSD